MIKAVFFDIDGTLISFKTHKISDSTLRALDLLKKQGVKIFIATGRAFGHITHLAALPFDGFITYNGAYCLTAEKQSIFKGPVPQEDLDKIVTYLKKHNDPFPCSFMTEEGTFINYIDTRVEMMAKLVNVPLPTVLPLKDAARKEVIQIGVYLDQKSEQAIMKEVLNNCETNRWHNLFTDVNRKGSTKKAGIDKVISFYDISLSQVMAFGDGGNDLDMLAHVPYGVAMGNASEHVKAAASYVTDSVDDNGIWNALVRLKVLHGDICKEKPEEDILYTSLNN